MAFPKMPNLEQLLEDKVLEKIPKTAQYNLNRTHPFWDTFNKVLAARYWEYLINIEDFANDTERLMQWKRVFLMNNWISPYFQDLIEATLRKRFIETAFDLVNSEADLKYSESEIVKWRWDKNRLSSGNIFSESSLNIDLQAESFFKLFFILKETVPSFLNVELQSARLSISCLIEQIVHSEAQYFSGNTNSFHKTRQLIKDSFKKPYLLWNITCLLERNYPEVIPYALTEPTTAAWGMWLLEQLKYQGDFESHSNRIQHQIKLKQLTSDIWLQGFGLILHHLSLLSYSKFEEIDVLFDTLYFK